MGIGLSGLSGIAGIGGGSGYRPSPQQSYMPRPPVGSFGGNSSGGSSGGDLGGLGQLKMAANLGKFGAGAAGNTELAGQLGAAGQGLGYLGALNSAGNILQGRGGVNDYTSTGKAAYDLYNKYQAAQAASEAGAAGGGEAATGASGGEAGAGAGMGGGMAFTGALGAMIAYGAARDATEARNRIEGARRTAERLQNMGVSQSELDPNKLFQFSTPWLNPAERYSPRPGEDQLVDRSQANSPLLQLNEDYYNKLVAAHPRIASEIGAGDVGGDYGQIFGSNVLGRGYQAHNTWLDQNDPTWSSDREANLRGSGG